MQNKRQLHLKTIMASNWVGPETLQHSQCKSKTQPKHTSTSKQNRPSSCYKLRCSTESKDSGKMRKTLIINNMMNKRATLRSFPKRESPLKNGNPYRYFLSSSKKLLTSEKASLNRFKDLMEKISMPVHKGQLSIRRSTQSCYSKLKSTKTSVPVESSRICQRHEPGNPEPWFLREEPESDLHF